MTNTPKQVVSDKIVALYQIDEFREWLDRLDIHLGVSAWDGGMSISTNSGGYNFIGGISLNVTQS